MRTLSYVDSPSQCVSHPALTGSDVGPRALTRALSGRTRDDHRQPLASAGLPTQFFATGPLFLTRQPKS